MNDLADLTPGQVAEFREAWSAAGHAPEQFDAALNGTPQEAAQDPFADLTEEALEQSLATPVLDARQADELADALRAAGVPDDQINAALAADGFDPMAKDERTDEQKEFDVAWRGGRPDEYRVNYQGRATDLDAGELVEFNGQLTAWLSSVAMPPSIGVYVAERAMDVGKALSGMSEDERALWRAEQASDIERLAGSPEAVGQLRLRVAEVIERSDDLMAAGLIGAGILEDAEVFLHLARHGERLAWRG